MSSSTSIAITAIVATIVGAATGAGLAHAYALGRAQAVAQAAAQPPAAVQAGAHPSALLSSPAAPGTAAKTSSAPIGTRADASGITRVACRTRTPERAQ